MSRQNIIWEYQNAIKGIYREENINCLRGENESYLIKDRPILLWHSQVTRKCKLKYQTFDQFKNIDDLLLYSDQVMHFTAQLYLYRPYLNNPLDDAFAMQSGMMVYPNYQNLEAKRYNMYTDIVSEKLYSYWHRIGDLIAAFFPELIKPERVFFATAFDIIPKEYHNIESYKWLKNFRETTFKEINSKRKEIVHYTSSDTESKYKLMFNKGEREEVETWVSERHRIADEFKNQIDISIEGFYQTMLMLEEINKTLFADIE